MHVLRPLACRLAAEVADHDDDIALAAEHATDFFRLQRAGFGFVRTDEGLLLAERGEIGRLDVDVDQRNASFLGNLADCRRAVRIHGVDDDGGDATGGEISDLVKLLVDVVCGIHHLQIEPLGLGVVLHAVGDQGLEIGRQVTHRNADPIGGMGLRRQHERERACTQKLQHVLLPGNSGPPGRLERVTDGADRRPGVF